MPSRPWPLWLLTGLVLLGFPVVNFIYWPQVLRSGVLPVDGDSIGIPIFGSILAALVLSPLILGVTWLCLRRYNPKTRFIGWRSDRPIRTATATLSLGSAAALLAIALLSDLRTDSPWYEYLWSVYFALWVPWLLGLRAPVVDQLEYEPFFTER